ncbi:MAG TPA: SprT family zinc-dependent metalloprotease [Nitrososphaeraceae archaeon]|nr:SprT family zinc-dependent metalloprotease [Nitrososphaeraceae archaeon]
MSSKTIQNYQYGNRKINYTLVRSKRRKTSELIVDKNEITIRAPLDKSISEVEKILDDKINWIIKKQKEYEYTFQEILKPTFLPNSTIPYLGKNYNLRIVSNNKRKNSIEIIDDDNLLIFVDNFEIDEDTELLKNKVRYLYNKWLNQKAKEIFLIKIKKYSKLIGVSPPQRIILKNLKNRWGSVTKKDTINLNRNLVKAPEDIIDYIIIHELCHIKIQGHSHHFWSFLKQFVPDYLKKIDWLNRNSENLIS